MPDPATKHNGQSQWRGSGENLRGCEHGAALMLWDSTGVEQRDAGPRPG
jgi:hypothetical protein